MKICPWRRPIYTANIAVSCSVFCILRSDVPMGELLMNHRLHLPTALSTTLSATYSSEREIITYNTTQSSYGREMRFCCYFRDQGSCLMHLSFLIGYQPPTQQHTAFFMLGGPLGYLFQSWIMLCVVVGGGWYPIKNDKCIEHDPWDHTKSCTKESVPKKFVEVNQNWLMMDYMKKIVLKDMFLRRQWRK